MALIVLVGTTVSYLIYKSAFGNATVVREGTSIAELVGSLLEVHNYAKQRVNILIKELVLLFVNFHLWWLIALLAIRWFKPLR